LGQCAIVPRYEKKPHYETARRYGQGGRSIHG
jgi:hypothetical protein